LQKNFTAGGVLRALEFPSGRAASYAGAATGCASTLGKGLKVRMMKKAPSPTAQEPM
jgi:hypothetical protein